MKSIKFFASGIAGLMIILLVISCNKSKRETFAIKDDLNSNSLAQVFVGTVNASRNYVYVDANPVTGALLSSGSVFPSTGYAFAVPGGLRSFLVRDTLRTTTQLPLVFSEYMDITKNYTIFLYDTISSPKQKTVETNIVVPSDNSARVRFANFAYFQPGVPPGVDIFSKTKNANVFTNVSLTDVTDFITYTSGAADSLIVRSTGTVTALDTAVFTFNARRSYTLVFRGRYAVNESGGATFPRTLSSFINY